MRVSRFFIDTPLCQGQYLTLPPNLINYIVNVLRLKIDDTIVLFNAQQTGKTGEFTAILTEVTKRHAVAYIENFTEKKTESQINIHLFQGISRSEKMDFTIQKAIELGVNEITPVLTQRSNTGKLNTKRQQKKMQHWQGVANSACEQSGRTVQVIINEPVQLEKMNLFDAEIKLLLSPDASSKLSERSDLSPTTVNLFIGPEGGLNNEEINWACNNGYQKIRLGPRILRTETAGLAILSILQYLWGDLA